MNGRQTSPAPVEIQTPFDFGCLVRSERVKQSKSQEALATEAGVSRKWLSEVENGKETAELGLAFAVLRALGYALHAVERVEPEFDIDAHLRSLTRRD